MTPANPSVCIYFTDMFSWIMIIHMFTGSVVISVFVGKDYVQGANL